MVNRPVGRLHRRVPETYLPRLVDGPLARIVQTLPAVSLVGARSMRGGGDRVVEQAAEGELGGAEQ